MYQLIQIWIEGSEIMGMELFVSIDSGNHTNAAICGKFGEGLFVLA